ncbi:MAG: hypothetical protein EON58_15525 [Alphaproteobacteria bacterium]|nr:MAG: hypothetical protein EON58_15525 [Alphaproteobacteria bacterium]
MALAFAIAFSLAYQTEVPPVVMIPRRDPDGEACAILRDLAARTQADLPLMADKITRTDGFSVMCGLRTVTWNKTFLVDLSNFREGWQGRKQAQFSQIVCESEAFLPLARRGWRFAMNVTFQSGQRFVLDADCRGYPDRSSSER